MILTRLALLVPCIVLGFHVVVSQGFVVPTVQHKRRHQRRKRLHRSLGDVHDCHPKFRQGTQLAALTANTMSAATGLLASSLVGMYSEGRILPSNAGILGTLLTSAVLSNLGISPGAHFLYEKCWSLVLPMSLAFLMLKESSPKSSVQERKDVSKVGLAFLIASMASFLGCTTSFFICRLYPNVCFTPHDAAIAGGCLCASYIGGSINFFATARVLVEDSSQQHVASLLSSMAAADLVVMALYLGWLSTAMQARSLLRFFGEEDSKPQHAQSLDVDKEFELDDSAIATTFLEATSHGNKLVSIVLVTLFAWTISVTANTIERWMCPMISGTACAVIAILGTIGQRSMLAWAPRQWCHNVQQAAKVMANFSFQLFFGAVGMSANLGQALQTSGWPSFLFSGTAVVIHLLLTIGMCRIVNALHCYFWKQQHGSTLISKGWSGPLKLSHVLVASNAAIGGPATAAAYAGQQKTTLAVAATVCGVVGYGLGTTIGIGASRWYLSLL